MQIMVGSPDFCGPLANPSPFLFTPEFIGISRFREPVVRRTAGRVKTHACHERRLGQACGSQSIGIHSSDELANALVSYITLARLRWLWLLLDCGKSSVLTAGRGVLVFCLVVVLP